MTAAAVVSFMGLGLVDPILPAIAHDLRASPSDVELLFTSYAPEQLWESRNKGH